MRVSTATWRVWRPALLAATLLVAPAAWGQAEEPGADPDAEGTAARAPGPELPGPAPAFEQAPQSYTVKRGDTLWEITREHLGNPWYWPKVWAENPEIVNPNWIEPGRVIRFWGADAGPTRIEAPETVAETGAPASDQVVDQTAALSYRPLAPTRVVDQAFVTDEELKASGRIVASWEEKMLLSDHDRIYVEFGDGRPMPGDRFAVIRTERQIEHPRTGRSLGWLTQILGVIRVEDDRGEGVQTAHIESSMDAIERGDRLIPLDRELLQVVDRRENTTEVEGLIVATLRPRLVAIGELHYVFVDQGANAGVAVGNTFEVIRRGDPLARDLDVVKAERLPWEQVGTLLAVDVREHVTTALVLDSVRELGVGDRAVMRIGATAQR